MTETVIKTYVPTPKQIQAHSTRKRYLLYGGAMGGGKSAWIVNHINNAMIDFPGNRGFIGRKYYADFVISTYQQIIKFLDPYIKLGLIVENKSRKTFSYWNGSILFYGGIESDDSDTHNPLFSAEFGVIGIDEAWEVSEDTFKKVGTRLRHKLPDGKEPFYQIVMATNPAKNWIKTRFIIAPNPETDCFIQALPKENPHNPEDYEQQIRDLFRGDQKFISAFLEGSWDEIGDPDDLLSMGEIHAAFHKDLFGNLNNLILRAYDYRVVSIDPAYFGDDKTVLYGWKNELVTDRVKYGKQDPVYTFGQAISMEQRLIGRDKDISVLFVVDDTGGYGSGVVALLHEAKKQVLAVNFNGEPEDKDHYTNIRSEMYWEGSWDIKDKVCAVPEKFLELHGELSATKYKRKSDTKIYIESKDDIKKRIKKSPDEADTFMLGLLGLRRLRKGHLKLHNPQKLKTADDRFVDGWIKLPGKNFESQKSKGLGRWR